MSIKATRKVGFFTALCLVIGAVIGVGIFFKNGGIGRDVGNDGVSWLLTWILGGLIASAAAFNFSNISNKIKNGRSSGLTNWAEQLGGKKFGYFTRFNFGSFYLAILVFILGFFCSEILFKFIESVSGQTKLLDETPIYAHFLVGLAISSWFVIFNKRFLKGGAVVSQVTTVLKFLPLIMAIVIGIPLAATHTTIRDPGVVDNAFNTNEFNFRGIILALPAVLFAYDSFLNVGAITHKVKGGEKTVSKAIIFGMLSVVVIYTLVALSSVLHNEGTIAGVIVDSLPQTAKPYIESFVTLFIFISAMGACNGVSISYIGEIEKSVGANVYAGSSSLTKKVGTKWTEWIYTVVFIAFWLVVTLIPSLIFETDKFVDAISNFTAVFFFAIYFIVIALYYFKVHAKIKNKTGGEIMQSIASFISMIGLLFVLIAFVYFLSSDIANGKPNFSWGLFAGKEAPMSSLTVGIVWLIGITLFIGLPLLNLLFIKLSGTKDGLNAIDGKITLNLVSNEEDIKKPNGIISKFRLNWIAMLVNWNLIVALPIIKVFNQIKFFISKKINNKTKHQLKKYDYFIYNEVSKKYLKNMRSTYSYQ